MGALREDKEPGPLVGDPRRGGMRLFYAILSHRAGKYEYFGVFAFNITNMGAFEMYVA